MSSLASQFSGRTENREKLTRKQKESIGLLSIGTVLEYFDLYLYVHMAVLLNDLFFPKSAPTTAKLLAATAFCSTYIIRPFGGWAMGRLGDSIGRKSTLMITTFLMATACLIMAIIPEYKEVGIISTIMIIAARMLQGCSSLGEKVGAYLYMSESFRVPHKCIAGGLIGLSSTFGAFLALITAWAVFSFGINWRWAFGVGAGVAVIGIAARTRLRETAEFVDYKRRISQKINKNTNFTAPIFDKKTTLAFFFTELHAPICFYIVVVHLGEFMKNHLAMSPAQVATHNLKVFVALAALSLLVIYLVKKIHPVKIAIVTASIFVLLFPFIPYWLENISSLFPLFLIQCLILLFTRSTDGTLDAIQYKYFPVARRFTFVATTFGIANPLAKLLSAFGLIPLTKYFGFYGLYFLFIPTVFGYCWALWYFRKLEIERGLYYNYPNEDLPEEENNEALSTEEISIVEPAEIMISNFMQKIKEINRIYSNKINEETVIKAIDFAKNWHKNQRRKTGELYWYHPLEVAEITAEHCANTNAIVAALLHDVVEDTACTIFLIKKEFGHRVAQIVDKLTRYEDKKSGKKQTIEEIIDNILSHDDKDALLIKQIDRLHNLSTIGVLKNEKQIKTAIETFKSIMGYVAYAVDHLNINDKLKLEKLLLKHCEKTLKKNNMAIEHLEELMLD